MKRLKSLVYLYYTFLKKYSSFIMPGTFDITKCSPPVEYCHQSQTHIYLLIMTISQMKENPYSRTSDPLVKVNSTLSLTASTLLHRLVLLSASVIHPWPNVLAIQYEQGLKDWPGSEIQMYYGCPCILFFFYVSVVKCSLPCPGKPKTGPNTSS